MEDLLKIIKAVFDSQQDILVILDLYNRKAIYWNRIFSELTGYSDREIEQLPLPEALFSTYETKIAVQSSKRVLNGETAIQELEMITKNGQIIPVEFSGSLLKTEEMEHGFILIIGRDLRTAKEREKKLQESTELLQMVMDYIPQFVFWKDVNSVYLGCNNNFARGAGLNSPSEIIGKTDFDLPWTREEAEFYRKIDKQVVETGKPVLNLVEPQTTPTGKVIWLRTHKNPMVNQKGEIIGMMGNYEDITESKIINDSLEMIAAKFTHLKDSEFFESVCQHLTEQLDIDYVLIGEVTGDKKNVRLLGGFGKSGKLPLTTYSLADSPCDHVLNTESAMYIDRVREKYPKDRLLADLAIESYLGTPLVDQAGNPIGVMVMMGKKALEDVGLKTKVLALFADRVSAEIQRSRSEAALKDSEWNYRRLIQQSNDPIYMLVENRFVMVNKAFIDKFGFTEDELYHNDFDMLNMIVAPRSRDEIRARAESLKKGIEPSSMYEFTALSKDDEEIECQVNISYVDYKGLKAAQGILRDISERKRSEALLQKQKEDYQELSKRYAIRNEELRESIERIKVINRELEIAKEKAEESDRLKSAFLANMSHEIRTPMNGILGFANILKKHEANLEEEDEYLEIIESSGQRMLNLINDLIDISKIEAGLMEVHLVNFNLNHLMYTIHKFFQPMIEQKEIEIEYRTSLPDADSDLISDENKLHQILVNLINNAIKFTEKGIIQFGYKVKGQELEFYVRDTGKGIGTDLVEKIFERFSQGEHSFDKQYEGAGLGLAISKALVELLGGKIWVESVLDEGTAFYFTHPLKGKTPSLNNASVKGDQVDKSLLNGMTILVAEDDDISFRLITEILRPGELKIIRAATGLDAVETVQKITEIDLVLMDIKMPGLDGINATREIKKLRPELPVIIQTAFVQETEKVLAFEAGCNEYLTKPIDPVNLVRQITRYRTIS